MASQRVTVRCAACGCASPLDRFAQEHTVELVIHRYGGKCRIDVTKQPVDLETAMFLEQRLTAALEGLREGIAQATGAADGRPY